MNNKSVKSLACTTLAIVGLGASAAAFAQSNTMTDNSMATGNSMSQGTMGSNKMSTSTTGTKSHAQKKHWKHHNKMHHNTMSAKKPLATDGKPANNLPSGQGNVGNDMSSGTK